MAKVVRFHELGGPEVLRLEEITFEDPAPGELRLKVGAIGLNRLEVVYRSGGFGAPNKYPAALGSECAGTVEAIGKGVTGFKIGDGNHTRFHDPPWFRDRDERSRMRGLR